MVPHREVAGACGPLRGQRDEVQLDLVLGVGGVEDDARRDDPAKPRAACVYLWARNPNLCNGPRAAGKGFVRSRTEGQLILSPGLRCQLGRAAVRWSQINPILKLTGDPELAFSNAFAGRRATLGAGQLRRHPRRGAFHHQRRLRWLARRVSRGDRAIRGSLSVCFDSSSCSIAAGMPRPASHPEGGADDGTLHGGDVAVADLAPSVLRDGPRKRVRETRALGRGSASDRIDLRTRAPRRGRGDSADPVTGSAGLSVRERANPFPAARGPLQRFRVPRTQVDGLTAQTSQDPSRRASSLPAPATPRGQIELNFISLAT